VNPAPGSWKDGRNISNAPYGTRTWKRSSRFTSTWTS
jgi:hypothetical protein